MINSISFITAHFYDFDWTTRLVRNIRKFTPEEKIKEILIINQDRTLESQHKLQALDPLIRVVEYPESKLHYKLQWHDHASVLNQAIHDARGESVCIFDSDAHPMNEKWLIACESIFEYYDAILALQPGRVMDTHPCFMFFKGLEPNLKIVFDDGLEAARIDVGRRVGIQLLIQGKKVYMASSRDTFYGQWGHAYLDVIYHHQSGSFQGSKEHNIQKRVKWQIRYFKRLVIDKEMYKFTVSELGRYIITRILHGLLKK